MRATMSLSAFSENDMDEDERVVTPSPSRGDALRSMMKREMGSTFNLHPRAASMGVKAAMKLMAGVSSGQDRPEDDEGDGVEEVVDAEEWEGGEREGEEERLTQAGARKKWHAISALVRRKSGGDDEWEGLYSFGCDDGVKWRGELEDMDSPGLSFIMRMVGDRRV